MSRAQLTSTVEQNSAGAAAPLVAGKNLIINGGFDIAQRGTSVTLSSAFAYSLDRWNHNLSSSHTISQQSTGVPAGSRYCMRVATNASGVCYAAQIIETANVVPLQGQTVTISAKIRRNSSFIGDVALSVLKSSTIDAAANASFTGISSASVTNVNMPTGTGSANWYTLTTSLTVPNDGTANTLKFEFTPTTTQTSVGAYYEIAQCQIEVGSVATPFSRAGGTLQGELALCQRYYERQGLSDSGSAGVMATGVALSTTSVYFPITPLVPKRTSAAFSFSGQTDFRIWDGVTSTVTTAMALFAASATSSGGGLVQATVSSGLTQYRPYFLFHASSVNSYIELSAEL